MKEIIFQPSKRIDLKKQKWLTGVYVTDEKKFLKDYTKEDIDKMIRIKAESLWTRYDLDCHNYSCYIEYYDNEIMIHVIVKENEEEAAK